MRRADRRRSVSALPNPRRRIPARPTIEGLEGRALLSTILGLTSQDSLVTFDSATPATISAVLPISGLPSGEKIAAIDFQPTSEAVYGLGNKGHLYTINLASGAATAISKTSFTTGLIGSQFSMDENPVTSVIRVVDDSGQNLRVDSTNGTVVASDAALAYASGDPNAGKVPDVVGLAYTNGTPGATTTTALAIDATTATLDRLGSPGGVPNSPDTGQLTTVGSLGVAVGAGPGSSFGFDVVGSGGTAYAVLSPTVGADAGKTVLYAINLANGAATSVGRVGDGSPVLIGIAASTLAPPAAPSLAPTSESGPVKGSHVTNITTPTITGTALPGATVWILANGNLVGQGTATSSGTYAIPTAKLADGTYLIQAVQFDASGLPSGASQAMSPPLVVETMAPAAPGVPSLIPADDTGFSNTDHYTRNNIPAFTGTGEPGATVFLIANGTLVGSATVGSDGTYSVASSKFPDGTYTILASQSDQAGNLSPASAAMSPSLVIDTTGRPTPQESYIGTLYFNLFGRPVDAVGLASWTAALAGPNGRNVVVAGLLGSTGYTDQVARSTSFALLGRGPTAAELSLSQRLLASERIELYKAQVAGTPEFYADAGSTTAGFLARLGQTILGRPIDATSQALYTAQLKAGVSRTTVAYEVLTSPAGYTATADAIFAGLGLPAYPSSIAASVSMLQHGGSDQQLIQGLATTDVYFARAQGNGTTIVHWTQQVFLNLFGYPANASALAPLQTLLVNGKITPLQAVQWLQSTPLYQQAVVTSLYESILGRAPDAAGLATWTNYLAGGGTVETVKAQLLSSSAFFANQGGGTAPGALTAMYQYVVGQAIPSQVLTTLTNQLASGVSFYQIASSLLYSQAGASHTVQVIYTTYLRRPPTFAEVSGLSTALSVGAVTDPQIIAALVASDEYFAGL